MDPNTAPAGGETDMTETVDYREMRAWAKTLRMLPNHLERLLQEAREDGAPPDALHKRVDGRWVTAREELPQATPERRAAYLAALKTV